MRHHTVQEMCPHSFQGYVDEEIGAQFGVLSKGEHITKFEIFAKYPPKLFSTAALNLMLVAKVSAELLLYSQLS